MNIGENLIKIRKKANLKQEEMASLINVSPKTISSWENNRNLPSIEMIILIANTLNIKIDDIKLPIKKNAVVGKINVIDNEDVVATGDLVIDRNVDNLSFLDLFKKSCMDLVNGII